MDNAHLTQSAETGRKPSNEGSKKFNIPAVFGLVSKHQAELL